MTARSENNTSISPVDRVRSILRGQLAIGKTQGFKKEDAKILFEKLAQSVPAGKQSSLTNENGELSDDILQGLEDLYQKVDFVFINRSENDLPSRRNFEKDSPYTDIEKATNRVRVEHLRRLGGLLDMLNLSEWKQDFERFLQTSEELERLRYGKTKDVPVEKLLTPLISWLFTNPEALMLAERYVDKVISEQSRKRKELLKEGLPKYVSVLTVGEGVHGVNVGQELLSKYPSLAERSLTIGANKRAGGQFRMDRSTAAFELNSRRKPIIPGESSSLPTGVRGNINPLGSHSTIELSQTGTTTFPTNFEMGIATLFNGYFSANLSMETELVQVEKPRNSSDPFKVRLRDGETGEEFEVLAGMVFLATGIGEPVSGFDESDPQTKEILEESKRRLEVLKEKGSLSTDDEIPDVLTLPDTFSLFANTDNRRPLQFLHDKIVGAVGGGDSLWILLEYLSAKKAFDYGQSVAELDFIKEFTVFGSPFVDYEEFKKFCRVRYGQVAFEFPRRDGREGRVNPFKERGKFIRRNGDQLEIIYIANDGTVKSEPVDIVITAAGYKNTIGDYIKDFVPTSFARRGKKKTEHDVDDEELQKQLQNELIQKLTTVGTRIEYQDQTTFGDPEYLEILNVDLNRVPGQVFIDIDTKNGTDSVSLASLLVRLRGSQSASTLSVKKIKSIEERVATNVIDAFPIRPADDDDTLGLGREIADGFYVAGAVNGFPLSRAEREELEDAFSVYKDTSAEAIINKDNVVALWRWSKLVEKLVAQEVSKRAIALEVACANYEMNGRTVDLLQCKPVNRSAENPVRSSVFTIPLKQVYRGMNPTAPKEQMLALWLSDFYRDKPEDLTELTGMTLSNESSLQGVRIDIVRLTDRSENEENGVVSYKIVCNPPVAESALQSLQRDETFWQLVGQLADPLLANGNRSRVLRCQIPFDLRNRPDLRNFKVQLIDASFEEGSALGQSPELSNSETVITGRRDVSEKQATRVSDISDFLKVDYPDTSNFEIIFSFEINYERVFLESLDGVKSVTDAVINKIVKTYDVEEASKLLQIVQKNLSDIRDSVIKNLGNSRISFYLFGLDFSIKINNDLDFLNFSKVNCDEMSPNTYNFDTLSLKIEKSLDNSLTINSKTVVRELVQKYGVLVVNAVLLRDFSTSRIKILGSLAEKIFLYTDFFDLEMKLLFQSLDEQLRKYLDPNSVKDDEKKREYKKLLDRISALGSVKLN